MLTVKMLINSVVSTKRAKFMTMEISIFYLTQPSKRSEYIHVSLKDMPKEIFNVETLLWKQVSRSTYVDHGQTVVTIAGHVVVSLASW